MVWKALGFTFAVVRCFFTVFLLISTRFIFMLDRTAAIKKLLRTLHNRTALHNYRPLTLTHISCLMIFILDCLRYPRLESRCHSCLLPWSRQSPYCKWKTTLSIRQLWNKSFWRLPGPSAHLAKSRADHSVRVESEMTTQRVPSCRRVSHSSLGNDCCDADAWEQWYLLIFTELIKLIINE